MTDPTPSERAARRRLINLGEVVAVAALVISALGLWNSWRDGKDDKAQPTTVVERKAAVPLALRGRIDDDGKVLLLSPIEPGHALDSLTITVAGKAPITVGSDGRVAASALQAAIAPPSRQAQSGTVEVKIASRYVEAGQDRRGGGSYRLAYRWDGGGLFGGRSLRITGFSRG